MFVIFYDGFCYSCNFELGMVFRILAGRRSVGYPLGARGFSIHLNAQNGFEAHLSSHSKNVGVLSLKIERPEHEAYQSPLFGAEV